MDLDDIHFQDGYDMIWEYVDCSVIIEPSEKRGGLFIGNFTISQDLKFLRLNNINVVLDLCGQKFVYPKDIVEHSKSISAEDKSSYNLSAHFQECFNFIDEHRNKKRNVLVHCMAGVSRSAAIIIGYLMSVIGMDFENAYKFVKKRRTSICPNQGFMRQLYKLEKEINAKKETSQQPNQ